MMPAYRSMESCPYQGNQMPFPQHYYPGIEAIPPQIKLDPSKSPFAYEQPWPRAGSFGYLPPTHFCCGHNHFPCYYSYRPAYPHTSSPSLMYYPGICPAYGDPFSVPYSPQPHYTMELPRYEYDKCMLRSYHCCGCPNNPCHQKEGKNVKIEEQEPDVGKKVNDTLVPMQLKNHPYPIVWIPPEYTGGREVENPVAAEVGEPDKMSHDRRPSGPEFFRADAQEPRVWNRWLPFDMNSAPNVVHDGDGRRNQNCQSGSNRMESEDGRINNKHQSEHKRSEFPFPIIWMPCYNKQDEGGRTNNQESPSSPRSIEEVPQTSESSPTNFYVGEGVTSGTRSNKDDSSNTTGSDATERATNGKIIPVKQMESHQGVTDKVTNERGIPVKQMESHKGKNYSEGSLRREKNIPVKQMEDDRTKKDSGASAERQSMSPWKTSKLPPVCLRVDPLPRKKNSNGSLRSPSPPASREHSQATAGETAKTPSCGMNDKAQPNSSLQYASSIGEKDKPKRRSIQVSVNKTSENKGIESADHRDGSQGRFNMPSDVLQGTNESCTNDDEYNTEEKKAENVLEEVSEPKEIMDSNKSTGEEGREERKVLSNVQAAVLIQAAYRGYQVRKWEPLKKLKQIAEVSKGLADVRGRIQALEASSGLLNEDKQRIAIGETIMRLLLKLDTYREIRKSLARELISLHEKLDSIVVKKTQQQTQELLAQKAVEAAPLNTQHGEYVQQQEEEKVAVPVENSSEGVSHGRHDMVEKCQDQICMKDGGSDSRSSVDLASDEGTKPIVPPNGMVNEDVSRVVTVDACYFTSRPPETDKMAEEHKVESEVEHTPVEVDNLDMIASKELPVGVIDEDLADVNSGKEDEQNERGRALDQPTGFNTMEVDGNIPSMVDDFARNGVEIHAMVELPVGLLDEDTPTSEFEKHEETGISKGGIQAEGGECIAELPVGLLDEDTATSDFEKHHETTISGGVPRAGDGEWIAELAVGLLDEDMVTSEFEKHDETKISGEDECNADVKTSFPAVSIAKEIQLQQQLLEGREEVLSIGGSDGWVKIEYQNEDEHKGDATLDIEVESLSGEETGNDTKQPYLTTEAIGLETLNGDVCWEVNHVKNIQEGEEPEGKVTLQETQIDGQDMVAEEAITADAQDTETLAKEKNEPSAVSPASEELPVAVHKGELRGDWKLLEENEKLREMMKKLLEAGHEQLSVISDLTGRVKDLERKLARSKRVGTNRCKPATSKTSRMKSSSNPLQGRATGVAM